MAINKVIYGNETLIDITDTTATDSTVLEGTVFYNAAGVRTVGSALAGISDVQDADGNSLVSGGIATIPAIPSSYSDVGAASASHTHTAADVGAVPTSRTVNGKALSSNITLTAADVGALPDTTVIPAAQVNSDWNATSGVAQILNKPTIPSGVSNTGQDKNAVGYLLGSSNNSMSTLTMTKTSRSFVTSTDSGTAYLQIGRSHSEEGQKGFIRLGNGDGQSEGYTDIVPTATGNKVLSLPAATGTLALTSQIPTVPTNVSAFTNDAGYISSYTETDPTVPSWAKAASKPTYIYSDVGAASAGHTHSDYATQSYVDSAVASISIPTEIFWVNVTATSPYTADQTYSAISDAIDNGQMVYVNQGGCIFALSDDDRTTGTGSISFEYIAYTESTGGIKWLSFRKLTIASDDTVSRISSMKNWVVNFPSALGTQGQIITANAAGNMQWSNMPAIPSTISQLTNDAGYLTLADLPIYDGSVS